MNAFLAELGKQFAEKWLTLLVIPGLLFVGVAAAGDVLGQTHWHDIARLRANLDALAADPVTRSPAVFVLVAAGVLGGSVAMGFVVRGISGIVERFWLGQWPSPLGILAQPFITRRQRRWTHADRRYKTALQNEIHRQQDQSASRSDAAGVNISRLNAVRNRIALHTPQLPTWMGDRILAADTRVHVAYDLDLTSAWPHLWLMLPDISRNELSTVRARFDAATRLAGWGLFYLVLACWWWPAGLVGAAAITTAWKQGRATMDSYAQLVEAAVDLHGRDLAESLGIDCRGPFTRDAGLAITRTLRKNV